MNTMSMCQNRKWKTQKCKRTKRKETQKFHIKRSHWWLPSPTLSTRMIFHSPNNRPKQGRP